ncbi:MAG: hypothetical protein Q8M83_00550 [bacterium]|nr:hypothetical protein [bacterium]
MAKKLLRIFFLLFILFFITVPQISFGQECWVSKDCPSDKPLCADSIITGFEKGTKGNCIGIGAKKLGETCKVDGECGEGMCINSICTAKACRTTTDCPTSTYCATNKVCMPIPPEGITPEEKWPAFVEPKLEVPLPNLSFQEIFAVNTENGRYIYIPYLAQYAAALFKWLVAISGILAGMMIVYAGVKWMLASGNPEKINEAKHKIGDAIIGLILVVGSYTIMYIVNPDLVTFKALRIQQAPRELFVPETEIPKSCKDLPNDPSTEGCVGLVQINGGFYLQKQSAEDFNKWMADFGKTIKVNYTYRGSGVQKCLKEKMPKVAAEPCHSPHELARAVDLNVASLTTEEYRKLLTMGLKYKWHVNKDMYKPGGVIPENWKDSKIDEHWHFNYKGNFVNDIRTLCPKSACNNK